MIIRSVPPVIERGRQIGQPAQIFARYKLRISRSRSVMVGSFYFRGSLVECLILLIFSRAEPLHGQVLGLVALDQILWFFVRGVDSVSLERDRRGDFFLNRAPDSACFRVPLDMIPNFEVVFH